MPEKLRNTCERTPWWCPILPIAPPLREHALELRTRDRERKLLKKIEQSIQLIDSGEYGYCDETGEPIGIGRLLARPTANLSLEAQQRREMKQKMFGG